MRLTWGDVPAWLSLAISAAALFLSYRAQRDANTAQQKIAEIEERREAEGKMKAAGAASSRSKERTPRLLAILRYKSREVRGA